MVGGGKSHAIRILTILYASMVPGLSIYLMRRLHEDVHKNHFENEYGYPNLLDPWVRSGYAQIVYSSPREIRFKNGSKIFITSAQHEKDKYKLLGMEIGFLALDEASLFSPTQIKFFRTRVRLGGLKIDVPDLTRKFNSMLEGWGLDSRVTEKHMENYFPRIVYGTNPGGPAHDYLKTNFVDASPSPGKIWKAPIDDGGMYRAFIPSLLTDNPVLLANDPHYADRVRGIGDPDKIRALLEGDWNLLGDSALGSVWDEGIHWIEPFEIPDTWYLDRSFDWGSAKPWSYGLHAECNGDTAVAPDGTLLNYPPRTLFRVNELYGCKKGEPDKGLQLSAYEVGERIAAFELTSGLMERIKPGPADSAIFDLTKFRDAYISIHDELLNGYNSYMKKHGGRIRGSLFVPADKSPGSRVKGLEAIRTLLQNATREPLEAPGVFIFNKCLDFKRTVPHIQRDQRNPEDINTDAEDHVYDEFRYRCMSKRTVIKKLSNYL